MSLSHNIVNMDLNNVMPQCHRQNETRAKKDAPTVEGRKILLTCIIHFWLWLTFKLDAWVRMLSLVGLVSKKKCIFNYLNGTGEHNLFWGTLKLDPIGC